MLGRDRVDGVVVFGAEAAEEVQDLAGLTDWLACLTDWLTDVAHGISELLEAAVLLRDVHVTLDEVAVLSMEVHDAVKLVVAKLVTDLVPDEMHRGLGSANDGEKILGDGVVQSADDALIDNSPLRVAALSWSWWGGEVVAEDELADEGVEEATPLIVVWLGELEGDRNTGFDVHGVKDSSRRRCDGSSITVVGRGGGVSDSGTGVTREVEVEERVVVHGRHGNGRGEGSSE